MKHVLLMLVFALSSTYANGAGLGSASKCTTVYSMHPGPVVETSVEDAQKSGVITIKYMSGSDHRIAAVIAKSVREADGSVVLFGVVLAKDVCPDSFSTPSESQRQVTVAIADFAPDIKEFRVLK